MRGLLASQDDTEYLEVLNGIAYDKINRRLFVTGKFWPKLFEIKLMPVK
jgi:glutamine cyclotransferase